MDPKTRKTQNSIEKSSEELSVILMKRNVCSSKSMPNNESKKTARNWLDLPPELWSLILMKLGAIKILTSAQFVCSSWFKICNQPHLWRVIDLQNDGYSDEMEMESMFRRALDRSLGQVIDVNIQYFGYVELLEYVVQKSNQQLRRLGIAVCYDLTDEALTVVTKLPLLEHLEITLYSYIWKSETFITVGRCCPLLKSLKLNQKFMRGRSMVSDEQALAIVESMPKLRYLQIFGNCLTDKGLQAILDGCPDLESLDLRQCFNLSSEKQLKEKCAGRIKTLHLPNDPTNDYNYCTEIDYDSEDED